VGDDYINAVIHAQPTRASTVKSAGGQAIHFRVVVCAPPYRPGRYLSDARRIVYDYQEITILLYFTFRRRWAWSARWSASS
jgi:hypothetical protein